MKPCQQHLTRDHTNCFNVTIALYELYKGPLKIDSNEKLCKIDRKHCKTIRKLVKIDTKALYIFNKKIPIKILYESPASYRAFVTSRYEVIPSQLFINNIDDLFIFSSTIIVVLLKVNYGMDSLLMVYQKFKNNI